MGTFTKWLSAIGLSTLFSANAQPVYKVLSGSVTVLGADYKTFTVNSTTSRVDLLQNNGEELAVWFTYNGPTDNISLLADGNYQEQFGLKLRSSNTCNLVYVMRRISPISKITVLYKQNFGMTTHEQCGDKGYIFVRDIIVPPITPGTRQKLSAKFKNNLLTVWVDNVNIWSGNVNYSLKGVGGIRTDNVKVSYTIA